MEINILPFDFTKNVDKPFDFIDIIYLQSDLREMYNSKFDTSEINNILSNLFN